jgi:hypothetical protein
MYRQSQRGSLPKSLIYKELRQLYNILCFDWHEIGAPPPPRNSFDTNNLRRLQKKEIKKPPAHMKRGRGQHNNTSTERIMPQQQGRVIPPCVLLELSRLEGCGRTHR